MRRHRFVFAALIAGLVLTFWGTPRAQSSRQTGSYTVLTADGRKTLAAVTINDQDMLRLDEVAGLFGVTAREDRSAKALTVAAGTKTVILSLDQGLASIGGRLVSVAAPPVREGKTWYVPADFVSRALPLVLGTPIELRRASRLFVVGALRAPRITIRPELVGNATRVTLDVTPKTTYAITQDGRRLVVAFDADVIDVTTTSASAGFVEQVTMIEPASVVLALTPGHGQYRATTVPVDAASSRIIIDVVPAGTATTPASVSPMPPQPEPPAAQAAFSMPMVPALRTVVIDPGHGGDENGARGPAGTLEKDVTLEMARRLKSVIEARLGIRVLLTREEDRIVPLDERAALANNNKADLFVSLHANASPRKDARGAEVFYLSLDAFDADSRRLAEAPTSRPVPQAGGGSRDIQLILWDMAQARHLAESSVFAGYVEEELRKHVDMSPRPIQQAPFRVLVAANMPAVLVEMGYISNPDQETALNAEPFRAQIVQALFDAIVRYRARLGGGR